MESTTPKITKSNSLMKNHKKEVSLTHRLEMALAMAPKMGTRMLIVIGRIYQQAVLRIMIKKFAGGYISLS